MSKSRESPEESIPYIVRLCIDLQRACKAIIHDSQHLSKDELEARAKSSIGNADSMLEAVQRIDDFALAVTRHKLTLEIATEQAQQTQELSASIQQQNQ